MWKKISDVNGNFRFALLGRLADPGREQQMGSKIGKLTMWMKISNVKENCQCERKFTMWMEISNVNGNFWFAKAGQLAGQGRQQKWAAKLEIWQCERKFSMWKKIFNVKENCQCERKLPMWTKIAELTSKKLTSVNHTTWCQTRRMDQWVRGALES